MIDALRLLRDQCGVQVTSADWAILSRSSDLNTTPAPIADDIFYAHDGEQNQCDPTRSRTKGLFADVPDEVYTDIYRVIRTHPHLRFPDVPSFLKLKKSEGKLISTLMTHVGQWLHERPYAALDRTPLRYDFIPSLRKRYGDNAATISIDLQHKIAVWVTTHIEDLTSTSLAHLVQELPASHSEKPENYRNRFQYQTWSSILHLVYDVSGPHFQGTVMQYFNHHPPHHINSRQMSSLPSVVSHALSSLPEVSGNPVLKRQAALTDLTQQLQPTIAQWIIHQCSSALDESWRWPDHILARLREDIEHGQAMLSSSVERDKRRAPGEPCQALQAAPASQIDGSSRQRMDRADAASAENSINLQQQASPSSPATEDHIEPVRQEATRTTSTSAARQSLTPRRVATAYPKALPTPRTAISVGLSRTKHEKSGKASSGHEERHQPRLPAIQPTLASPESFKRRKITTPGGTGWRTSRAAQPPGRSCF